MAAPQHPAHRRVLDAAAGKGVTLDIVTFPDSTHTAEQAARAVGTDVARIVKSLVFVAPRDDALEPVLALVSGANRVDIGRLGAVLGMDGMRRATAQEAGELTGFVIGGIPPMGHRRPLRVVMDADLDGHPEVWAAAGTPNAVFRVTPATLRMLADATIAPIGQPLARPADAGDGRGAPEERPEGASPDEAGSSRRDAHSGV